MEQLTPVSSLFGLDRGRAIDRYYIEHFLSEHQLDIRGHVLEVEDDVYATRFGEDRLQKLDILHVYPGNPRATIVADLTAADSIPSESFDCIILTQTLQFIYDTPAAIAHLHRILKHGGVLLATVPGISQISRYDTKQWPDFWRFTTSSISRLFGTIFSNGDFEVRAYGNAFVASAFLHGLSVEELAQNELEYIDTDYQMLITTRAVRE